MVARPFDPERLLRALARHRVDYVLIGAVAARLQGFPRTARQLAEALQVTVLRKIAGDGTFSVDGRLFEVRGRHLHGKRVQVLMDPLTGALLDVRHDEKPVPFGPCDPAVNRHRRRAEPSEAPAPTLPFDPIAALLAAARKETP